jgi:ABC-2 type transport system permease protein
MKRIGSQAVKELAQFKRDRLTLALAFILPLLTLFIFGYAIRLEAKNIPIAIQDFSNTPLSRSYVERLFATNQFEPAPLLGGTAQRVLDRGGARAVVVIPPDFAEKIQNQQPSTVQVAIDATDVNNARVVKNYIAATTRFFLQTGQVGALQKSEPPRLQARTRIWFNPGRKESLYIVPGTCAVILWIYPSLLSALAMVREKEQGTIVQVYASSLTASELILGKALAFLLIGLCEAAIVISISAILFSLTFAGDPTPFIIGTPIYILAATMFGLMLGTRASNQTAAVQGVALVGFLAALLLSGFIYPVSNIPFPLSFISNIVPARYYILIIRDAFVRGAGWSGVWFSMLMLIVLGGFLFNVTRRNLSRMQLPD